MFIVPVFQENSSKYKIEVELNREVFRLKFQWNVRAGEWYMDILDADDNSILNNVKLVINYALLPQYKAIMELPEGDFIVWDLEKNPATGGITFDNFGKRYQLIFFSDEELESGEVINGI